MVKPGDLESLFQLRWFCHSIIFEAPLFRMSLAPQGHQKMQCYLVTGTPALVPYSLHQAPPPHPVFFRDSHEGWNCQTNFAFLDAASLWPYAAVQLFHPVGTTGETERGKTNLHLAKMQELMLMVSKRIKCCSTSLGTNKRICRLPKAETWSSGIKLNCFSCCMLNTSWLNFFTYTSADIDISYIITLHFY